MDVCDSCNRCNSDKHDRNIARGRPPSPGGSFSAVNGLRKYAGANCISRSIAAVLRLAVQDKGLVRRYAEHTSCFAGRRQRRRAVIDGALGCRDSVCFAFQPKNAANPFIPSEKEQHVSSRVELKPQRWNLFHAPRNATGMTNAANFPSL